MQRVLSTLVIHGDLIHNFINEPLSKVELVDYTSSDRRSPNFIKENRGLLNITFYLAFFLGFGGIELVEQAMDAYRLYSSFPLI